MAIQGQKTVWILGAGFSRALGGPLLTELFRPERLQEIRDHFPQGAFPDLARDIYWSKVLFNHGPVGERPWINAEQFLASVENAFLVSEDDSRSRDSDEEDRRSRKRHFLSWAQLAFKGAKLPSSGLRVLRRRGNLVIRRALAAECSRFSLGPYTEVWEPYLTWVNSLDPERDIIISFNYDCAVEISDRLLAEREIARSSSVNTHSRVDVPLPLRSSPLAGQVPLYKLHGSSNWQAIDKRLSAVVGFGKRAARGYLTALEDPIKVAGIAAPGGAKRLFVKERLQSLWDAAAERLREAAHIVILGYGLPATDEVAKAWLLDNVAPPSALEDVHVHVVLGSETERPSVRRLIAMLASIAPAHQRSFLLDGSGHGHYPSRLKVLRHAMGAEDFISRPEHHVAAKALAHIGPGRTLF